MLLICSPFLFLTFVALVAFCPRLMPIVLVMSYALLDSPWMSASSSVDLSFGFLDVLFHQNGRRLSVLRQIFLGAADLESWYSPLAVSLSLRNLYVFWLTHSGRLDAFSFQCLFSSFIHSQYKVVIVFLDIITCTTLGEGLKAIFRVKLNCC